MASPDDMGDRIQKLEALVSSLVRPPPGPANGDAGVTQAALAASEATNGYPSIESALQPTAPYGAVVPTTEGHHFIGESHWEAVLRDVCCQSGTYPCFLGTPTDFRRSLLFESP